MGDLMCPWCGSDNTIHSGERKLGMGLYQCYSCDGCGRRFLVETNPRSSWRPPEKYIPERATKEASSQ